MVLVLAWLLQFDLGYTPLQCAQGARCRARSLLVLDKLLEPLNGFIEDTLSIYPWHDAAAVGTQAHLAYLRGVAAHWSIALRFTNMAIASAVVKWCSSNVNFFPSLSLLGFVAGDAPRPLPIQPQLVSVVSPGVVPNRFITCQCVHLVVVS